MWELTTGASETLVEAWLHLFVVVVQLLNRVWLFGNMDCSMPGFLTHCPGLVHKLMSIESVMPLIIFILCPFPSPPIPSIFPSGVFSNEWLAHQVVQVFSFSISLPSDIQDWFHFKLTGLFLTSQGTLKVLSTIQSINNSSSTRNFFMVSSQPYTWLQASNNYIDICCKREILCF